MQTTKKPTQKHKKHEETTKSSTPSAHKLHPSEATTSWGTGFVGHLQDGSGESQGRGSWVPAAENGPFVCLFKGCFVGF